MKKTQSKYFVYVLPIIEAILICLWGGIYDFTFSFYGIIVFVGLWLLSRKRNLLIPMNITTYGLGILFLGYLISIFVARDKGVAFLGVIRIVMLIGFWLFWNNITPFAQKRMKNVIPDIAAVLTTGTFILYFFPPIREYLYQADRMGGVFQYSNTYALFLLISVVILFYREDEPSRKNLYWKYIDLCVLICGIIFCGSRSVLVLAVITLGGILIFEHKNRKIWSGILVVSVLFCLLLQLMMNLDIQRLLKLTLDSSTLNGRFLYWQDAVRVICENPLGLGYMGYYFLLPQFQTGNYVTKFVHNDILQCALDAGVIAAIALLVIVGANIWNKKNSRQNRIILIILLLHCLFDFDLQYSAMFCILLMCMEGEQEHYIEWKGISTNLVTVLTASTCVYFSIAFSLGYFGWNKLSLAMYPGNTFVRENRMMEEENGEDAEIIIKKNGMIASAYEYAAIQHLEHTEYLEAYGDIREMTQTAGYQMDYYNQAVYELSIALDQALKSNDDSGAQKILEEIQAIPERLDELEERTSALAYKINDKPSFVLEEQVEEYIQNLSGISLM